MGVTLEFDLGSALIMTTELNLRSRREQALSHILRVALLKKGEENIEKFLTDVLEQLSIRKRAKMLVNVLNELQLKGRIPAPENLWILLDFAKSLEDPAERAISLANLAILTLSTNSKMASDIGVQALLAWRQEDDLKVRISMGFELVDILAKIDLSAAKDLYQEIKELLLLSGAPLALGSLGNSFASAVELAIRAIGLLSTDLIEKNIELIEKWIERIPAKRIQGVLYAKLASSLYRTNIDKQADELVRTRVLPTINKLTSLVDRNELIESSLPVIFKYDPAEAEVLSNTLSISQKDRGLLSALVWNFANCFLGDQIEIQDLTKLRAIADRPKILTGIQIAGNLQEDLAIYTAVQILSKVIEASYIEDQINLTQALELLSRLDDLVTIKLPDPNNIRHEGFLVLALSEIHCVRSLIFSKLHSKGAARGLRKGDILKKWRDLCSRALQIPNTADRVFVMAHIASNMHGYYKKDLTHVVNILEQAQEQIKDIPSLIDRFERLDIIAETWQTIGKKTEAEFVLEQLVEMLEQFQGSSRDVKLKALVQTAYAIGNENLASDIVSRVDKPNLRQGMLTKSQRRIQVEILRQQPNKVSNLSDTTNLLHEHENIIGTSAKFLLEDLITGRGRSDHSRILNDWLLRSHNCHPRIIKDVLDWVVESSIRGKRRSSLDVFSETLELIGRMAEITFLGARPEGLESIENSFAGLSSKFMVFQTGEQTKARNWLCQWLESNVQKYLKICDPYFGLEELEYLACVPENSIILIVTTTKGIGNISQDDIELYWRKVSARMLPDTKFIIVPSNFESRFHDRVIIADSSGLDIGSSLNGLGKSRQKIAILSPEEARELEQKYLKDMLDSTAWLMDQGINPTVFFIGK